MKKSYLFGMLLSGAMLAACTADDDLNAVKVSQVNPSAPVFSVSFDDGDLQNRGIADRGSFTFVTADKMSLFHGITDNGQAKTSSSAATVPTSLGGWQNAIYKPNETDGDEGLTFTTNSMVNPGLAVMVYPAKEDFDGLQNTSNWVGQGAPIVKVSRVQGPKTKDSIPYISELITISANNNEIKAGAAAAGYGKDYNEIIKMKRAAGLFALKMNKVNEITVPGETLEIRSMTIALHGNTAADKYFHLQMPLRAEVKDAGWGDDYKAWKYIAALDTDTGKEGYSPVESITTKAISNDSAYFVLLPLGDRDLNYEGHESGIKSSIVTVNTNFGRVTIYGNEETEEVNNVFGSGKDRLFHEWFVNTVAPVLYAEAGSGDFKGEKRGNWASGSFNLNMDSLSLDKVHIANEADLKTALKAYDVIYANKTGDDKNATLILDGTKGAFDMSAATLLELENRMKATAANSGKGLKFVPCTEEAVCETIVVTNDGTAQVEIPSLLDFGANSMLVLQLKGNWKFTGVTKESTTSANNDNRKNIVGISEIILADGEVGLNNNIAIYSGTLSTSYAGKITVASTATVKMLGTPVLVETTLDNYGKIYVNTNQLFKAGNAGVITNKSEVQYKDNKGNLVLTGITATPGYIENKGNIGVQEGTDGKLYNYGGTIEIVGTTAATLVSSNAADGAKVSVNYGASDEEDNYIGTVLLPNANGNKLTNVLGNQGFIKLHINKSYPSAAETGMANYIILDEGCTNVTSDNVNMEKNNGTGETGLPVAQSGAKGTVKYIELGSATNVQFEGTTKYWLNGLVVPTGKTLQITNESEVVMVKADSHIFLTGYITNAGILRTGNDTVLSDDTKFDGYFGKGDKSHIVKAN